MKNKTNTYILIALVLGVWGMITCKILNGINPSEPEQDNPKYNVKFKPIKQQTMDSFSISAVERDPFLGTLTVRKKAPKQAKREKPKKLEDHIPTITYGGLIQKQNSKSVVFVVNINNKQYLLKQGQKVHNVILVSGDKTSIIVQFNGKNHTVKL